MYHDRTVSVARGRWRGILMTLGLPEACLRDKHGPCPICRSQNNFRWDNKDGAGTYICTCGAGDGMKLAMEFTGEPFAQVASRIDAIVGNTRPDEDGAKRVLSDDERRHALRSVYAGTQQVVPGDLADKYLTSRNLGELIYPKALRFGPALKDGQGGVRPCMVATVVDMAGKPVSLHRTFLRADGMAKAEMQEPRKMMPGELPVGACVRLCEETTGPIGIAEGIETAMSASAIYGLPVWSAINTSILMKWQPPEGCEEVAVFADNDKNFAGQKAAFALANRLHLKGIHVTVHIPEIQGFDWSDIHMGKKQKGHQ